jgi:hypothetical protein
MLVWLMWVLVNTKITLSVLVRLIDHLEMVNLNYVGVFWCQNNIKCFGNVKRPLGKGQSN